MNFNERHLDARQRVSDSNTGMRVRAGIDDDRSRPVDSGCMDTVEEGTFVIGLEGGEAEAEVGALQRGFVLDVRERLAAVSAKNRRGGKKRG